MSEEKFKVSPEILAEISLMQTPEEAGRTTDQNVIDVFAALARSKVIEVVITLPRETEMSLYEASGGKLQDR